MTVPEKNSLEKEEEKASSSSKENTNEEQFEQHLTRSRKEKNAMNRVGRNALKKQRKRKMRCTESIEVPRTSKKACIHETKSSENESECLIEKTVECVIAKAPDQMSETDTKSSDAVSVAAVVYKKASSKRISKDSNLREMSNTLCDSETSVESLVEVLHVLSEVLYKLCFFILFSFLFRRISPWTL